MVASEKRASYGNASSLVDYRFSGRNTVVKFLTLGLIFLLLNTQADAKNDSIEQLRKGQSFDSGAIMYDSGYSDMPYMVALPNGELFATLTISDGREGNDDQHIVAMRSKDGGKNWSEPVAIEPADGPEASWAMPYFEGGRLWIFYTYNTRDVRSIPLVDGGTIGRVDMLGDMAVRYSDDFGSTWSDRIIVPIPRTDIDRENGFEGRETIYWMSGAPVRIGDEIYIGLSKAISRKDGIVAVTEAFLFRTKNPVDPQAWELVPKGARGLRAPDGSEVAEEPVLVEIGNGGLYVVFRTTSGKLAQAVSLDGGTTWDVNWARHTTGAPVRNPRAQPKVYRLSDGRYVLWFHNNADRGFLNRNPVWMSCGEYKGGKLLWGEPSVLLYDPDPKVRMSYPSFLERKGKFLVSATNKKTARLFSFAISELCR